MEPRKYPLLLSNIFDFLVGCRTGYVKFYGLVWQQVLINQGKKSPRGNFLGKHNPPPPRRENSPATIWKLFVPWLQCFPCFGPCNSFYYIYMHVNLHMLDDSTRGIWSAREAFGNWRHYFTGPCNSRTDMVNLDFQKDYPNNKIRKQLVQAEISKHCWEKFITKFRG